MRSHPGRIFFAFLAPLTHFCTHRAPTIPRSTKSPPQRAKWDNRRIPKDKCRISRCYSVNHNNYPEKKICKSSIICYFSSRGYGNHDLQNFRDKMAKPVKVFAMRYASGAEQFIHSAITHQNSLGGGYADGLSDGAIIWKIECYFISS